MTYDKKAADRAYYWKNRAKILAYQKKYVKEHKEKVLKYQRKYYLKNAKILRKRYAKRIKIDHERWRSRPENRLKINTRVSAYYKTPHGLLVAKNNFHIRRARKKSSADGTITVPILKELMISQNNTCKLCTARFSSTFRFAKPHLDHIIPLSRGGAHSLRNIQWLCAKCNREKSNKITSSEPIFKY